MSRRVVPSILVIVTLSAGALSCSRTDQDVQAQNPIRDFPFNSVFFKVHEADYFLITNILRVRELSDDRLAVMDGAENGLLRIYTRAGSLSRLIGRFGDGPGDYKHPLDVCEGRDGSLYVADVRPRITRLTPAFAYDTLFRIPAFGTG